jgi:hypothetical protein
LLLAPPWTMGRRSTPWDGSPPLSKTRGRSDPDRSCQEALAAYGTTGDDLGDCFNVFLNAELDETGSQNTGIGLGFWNPSEVVHRVQSRLALSTTRS